jgi:hypothetical protein
MTKKNYTKKTLSVLLIAVLVSLTTGFFSGCKNEENPEPNIKMLTTFDFDYQQYGCTMNLVNMREYRVYVINSEEELGNYFTCENFPQVDFSKKTLLIACGEASNAIVNISTELLLNNNNYSLMVAVTISENDLEMSGFWDIALITDKINTQNVMLYFNQHF